MQRGLGRINPRKNTLRHIVIKLINIIDKEKVLKATKEEYQIIHRGTAIRLSADFSAETLQTRREWQDIFKVIKGENLQPRLLYPARISFRLDQEKLYRQAKAKRIRHHQVSLTTNGRGVCLGKKHKRRKRLTKTNSKQLRKWQYILITTLKVKHLKDIDWLKGCRNKNCVYAAHEKPTSDLGTYTD